MDAADVRSKIRDLMASGVLPEEPPPILGSPASWPPPGSKRWRMLIGWNLRGPCTICGEPDPQIQYSYLGGQVISVHAACDTLLELERAS
jgi:hypothetical protein